MRGVQAAVRRRSWSILKLAVITAVTGTAGSAHAQSHPTGVPALNSRPGAPYTVYLDFGGFSFTGNWGNLNGYTPGVTPAFDGVTSSFGTTDQGYMANIWSRVSEKYSAFNINVTTVDPAVAAGQAGSDPARQLFYDQTPQLMHTVIGASNWTGGGGVSFVGVTQGSFPSDPNVNSGDGYGYHTNWLFTNGLGGVSDTSAIGEAGSHENGHGLGLSHQSDFNGSTLSSEYSSNNNSQGNGSFAPVMGVSYYSQRGLWRSGSADINGAVGQQNDVQVILSNNNIGPLVDDGVSHAITSISQLALKGSTVNAGLAKGVIEPANSALPNPTGVANYTTDLFAFQSSGGTVSLSAVDGGERLAAGVSDGGATLSSTLNILSANGTVLYTASNNPATLSGTINQNLPAGVYYAQINSTGGESGSFGGYTNYYYDMGSYFLTGSGALVSPTIYFNSTSAAYLSTNWTFNNAATSPSVGNTLIVNNGGTVNYQPTSGNTNIVLSSTTTLSAYGAEYGQNLNVSNGRLVVSNPSGTGGSSYGILLLDGSSLYVAGTGQVNLAGALRVGTSAASPPLATVAGGVLTAAAVDFSVGGTLRLQGGNLSTGSVVLGGVNSRLNWTGGTLNLTSTGSAFGGTLTVPSGGTLQLDGAITDPLNVTSSGTANLDPNTGTGILIRSLNTITLVAGGAPYAQLNLLPAVTRANRQLLITAGLTIGGTTNAWQGKVDFANNDADLQSGSLAVVINQVSQGFNRGAWNGAGGIVSSSAANASHLTAIGIIQNNQGGAPLFTAAHLFDGTAPGTADILLKYTYFGDTNLDGKVDSTDYSRIDNGFLAHGSSTGWYNGDFNYDGVIDGSDYALIDNTFNTQGAVLSANIAAEIDVFSDPSSNVPEPAIGMLSIAIAGLIHPRRLVQCR